MIPQNFVKIHQQLANSEWSQDFHILDCVLHNIIGGATSIAHIRRFDLPHNPTKFREDPSIISDATVVTRFFHILVCVLHNIIGGATSITYVPDFDLPHDPTEFHEDVSTISDAREITRFSPFGLCIT